MFNGALHVTVRLEATEIDETLKKQRYTYTHMWKSLGRVWLFATLPVVYSLPVSSLHGILQTRILEWVAIPFSRGSSQPRDQTQVSHIADIFFTNWATGEAPYTHVLTWKIGHWMWTVILSFKISMYVYTCI